MTSLTVVAFGIVSLVNALEQRGVPRRSLCPVAFYSWLGLPLFAGTCFGPDQLYINGDIMGGVNKYVEDVRSQTLHIIHHLPITVTKPVPLKWANYRCCLISVVKR